MDHNQTRALSSEEIKMSLNEYFQRPCREAFRFADFFRDCSLEYAMILMYLHPFMARLPHLQHHRSLRQQAERVMLNADQAVKQILAFQEGPEELVSSYSRSDLLGRLISLSTVLPNMGGICGSLQMESVNGGLAAHIWSFEPSERALVLNKCLALAQENGIFGALARRGELERVLLEQLPQLVQKRKIILWLYCNKRQILPLLHHFEFLDVEIPKLIEILPEDCISLQGFAQFGQVVCAKQAWRQGVLRDCLRWWAVNKMGVLPERRMQFRSNLLASLLNGISAEELMAKQYLGLVTEGIQNRLAQGNAQSALLIWKYLAICMNMEATPAVKDASFFSIPLVDFVVETQPTILHSSSSPTHADQQENVEDASQERHSDIDETEIGQISEMYARPANIHDCIFGLRDQSRRQKILKILPQFILNRKDQVTLLLAALLRELFAPLQDSCRKMLVLLLNSQPEQFIGFVSENVLSRQPSLAEVLTLMDVLEQGVNALTEAPPSDISEQPDFYFKKVQSRYYRQVPHKEEKEKKSRRWGHTKISHEGRAPLKIVRGNVNRFHEVACFLYFKVIERLNRDIKGNLRRQPALVQRDLQLQATVAISIKYALTKYNILREMGEKCRKVLEEVQRSHEEGQDRNILLMCVQLLNKMTLSIDRYCPNELKMELGCCVRLVRGSRTYRVGALADHLEARLAVQLNES